MLSYIDLGQLLLVGCSVVLVALMFAVLIELRRLRETLHELLSSERENARSLTAAIYELGASSVRGREAKKSRGEVD
jgi:hypothetical protein